MLNSRETCKFKYEFKDCHVRLGFCLEKLFKLLAIGRLEQTCFHNSPFSFTFVMTFKPKNYVKHSQFNHNLSSESVQCSVMRHHTCVIKRGGNNQGISFIFRTLSSLESHFLTETFELIYK